MKKIRTARRVFQTQGAKGIASVLFEEKLRNHWIRFNKWLIGKIIEIKGDVISIDGCEFGVRSPAISTSFKSHFFFDDYEVPEREAIKHFLDPQLPAIELGGAMGVIACLTNKRLNKPQKHIVVEANPDILSLLEENRNRNGCQFTILHKAVAYGVDEVTFHLGDEFWVSSVQASSNKSVNVPTISLKEIVDKFGFEEFTLICDIEGGEVDLVKFDEEIFRHRVATLIIEVHEKIVGADPINNMVQKLKEMGFKPVFEKLSTYVFKKQDD